ncbi:MAG: V-type ATPase subunit a family protein [Pseudomonadota bacterium]|nr:V-type ATPase subunit a family protein [Pseudomonadota bacterium]
MSAYTQALEALQKRSKSQLEKFRKREVKFKGAVFKGTISKDTQKKDDDIVEYIRRLEKDVIELNSAIASLRDQEQDKP